MLRVTPELRQEGRPDASMMTGQSVPPSVEDCTGCFIRRRWIEGSTNINTLLWRMHVSCQESRACVQARAGEGRVRSGTRWLRRTHQDVVVLLQLRLPDFLLHLAVGGVDVRVDLDRPQSLADLPRVLVAALADGHNHDLQARKTLMAGDPGHRARTSKSPSASERKMQDAQHSNGSIYDLAKQEAHEMNGMILTSVISIALNGR